MKVIIENGKHAGRTGVFKLSGRGENWGMVQFTDKGNTFPRGVGIRLSDTTPA